VVVSGALRLALVLATLCPALTGCRPLLRWWLRPAAFESQVPPPAPDYADPQSWAALPDRDDWADQVPPGLQDRQADARVDVFFVHPTTFYRGSSFNAPIDDARTNQATDRGPMATQASVFNAVARVYAPRYRQVALGAYMREDREQGLDLAYGDVRRAFDYYLQHWNQGRPFFIASHSQGTRHAQKLLRESFEGDEGRPLRSRLIAAYLIGGWVPERRHARGRSDLPACETSIQIGCVIGWRTVGASGTGRDALSTLREGERNLCTNPLLWTRTPEVAPASLNLGSLPPGSLRDGMLPAPEPGLVGARCADGWLRIDEPSDLGRGKRLARGGDYHVFDYAFFYMNLRENARMRAEAFLLGHTRFARPARPLSR
jgi:hypothetical protein